MHFILREIWFKKRQDEAAVVITHPVATHNAGFGLGQDVLK
jgi:hypothetical protein